MVSISGCWAPEIWLASATSCGFFERSGTIAASSMACWWCGIMLVAKVTSSVSKPAGAALITAVSEAG